MKNWLDKYEYGGQAGYTDIPFDYNSAWGGQFAMGGSLPGTVGFTYARTQGAAPSNGPYAKKTNASAQNGQEMSYYQHGLDWKPKTISKNGSDIPKNQNAEFVLPRFDMPRAASESTSRVFLDPITGKQKSTATVGQKSRDVKASTEAMGKGKRTEEREKQKRINERKSAKAFNEGKSKTFTFPTGETKTLDQMDWRDKAYIAGKSLEGKGRFNEDDETFVDEWLNPLNWITQAAGALGTAPYEARESDSNLPYVGAVGNALFQGALGLDPLGSAIKFAKSPVTKSVAKTLVDIPRAESIKEAIGRVGGIPLKKDLPRMGAQDVKALRQVQEIGRLRATNSPYAEQMRYGLENNLPEEHFQKVFGRSREEAQHLLDTGFGEQQAAKSAGIRSRIDLRRPRNQSPREMLIEHLRNNEHVIHGAESEVRNIAGDANIIRADGFVNYDALSDEQLARLRDFAEEQNQALEAMDMDITPQQLNQGQRNLMNELFGDMEGLNQEELRARLNALEAEDDVVDYATQEAATDEAMRSYVPGDIDIDVAREPWTPPQSSEIRSDRVQNIVDRFSQPRSEYTELSPEAHERLQRAFNNIIIPGQERPRIPLSMQLRQDVTSGVNKLIDRLGVFVGNMTQNYPFYSGEVLEKVPSLNLSTHGGLKNVSKRVSFAPEGIQSGDVFTGSTNTSHSSYLPQLKQVFKYTKGDPQFLGYRPMNSLGFLSNYGYKGGDIAKYLNSEIDEQIKRGILPKDISRPFLKNESVMLPHYGVKQHKKGGVIKDDRGQWAHPGKITKINSNQITMKGVDYPVLGISDTGDKKMMYPEQEYTFKGKNVTEIPMAQKGKTLPPIYTDDPRKLKAYNDSLSLYEKGIEHEKFLREHGFTWGATHEFPFSKVTSYGYATKPKDKIKIQPISAVSQETNPSHPDYYRAEWLKYKKPVQEYIYRSAQSNLYTLKKEPKLKKKISNVNKISIDHSSSLPGVTSIQNPNIEIPNIQTGKYKVSYWDPEMKDWTERSFMTKGESDKFFNEAPTYYQTKQYVEKKSTGGWLDKYN